MHGGRRLVNYGVRACTIVAMQDQPAELGKILQRLRELSGSSLKAAGEQAGISAAYLLKLERGDVQNPSPHVLYRLAEALDGDYLDLMRRAGYVVPGAQGAGGSLAHALSAKGITDDEAAALAAYLTIYRQQRGHG